MVDQLKTKWAADAAPSFKENGQEVRYMTAEETEE